MKVWMLVFVLVSTSAYSSEFTHIKLNPEFEQYLKDPKTKSPGLLKIKALTSTQSDSPALNFQSRMMGALLGGSFNSSGVIPVDGEESPIFEEIRRHLENSYERLGLAEVANINRLNQQFNLGLANYSGFSWQKPFGVVQIWADRQVTPNLFGENWLIQDTFSMEIEASSFLEKLNQAGLSDMSAAEIKAFAGISFRRIYTYYHYADSYENGLGADFSKLFLLFTKFNRPGMEVMGHEDIMKREDTWTASTGALISTPPLYNLSFAAGILAEIDFQQMTSIQSNHSKNMEDQRFKVGVLNKKVANAGAALELQLDFFKLLKLSLLRYDLNYQYASGKEFTLGFNPIQWEEVKLTRELNSELSSILKGTSSVDKLEPYVVRLDESTSESLDQRGSVLIWGRLQKSKNEQIRVIKDDTVKTFFRSYSQNVKVVQNILSRIFSAIVYKLLRLPVGATNAAIYSQQVNMEYEASHPQATDPKVIRVENAEQFSFVLTQYYNAARTDRWIDRKFKNDVIWFVDNFTTLPKDYKTSIRQEHLKGPLMVDSNIRVEHAGLKHFINSSEDRIFGELAEVCHSEMKADWMNPRERKYLLKRGQSGNEYCVKDLGKKYLDFKDDYFQNEERPSIAKFKSFISKYYKESERIASLEALFGKENIFIHGRLQAKTGMGTSFTTSFSSGQFRGLGVIDNFKRSTGSRMPANIISE